MKCCAALVWICAFGLNACALAHKPDPLSNSALRAEATLAGPPPLVRGIVLDALDHRPIPDCELRGPLKSSARSGPDGRFELKGLPLGSQGELSAHASGERAGRVLLQPLESGTLEVVIFVR